MFELGEAENAVFHKILAQHHLTELFAAAHGFGRGRTLHALPTSLNCTDAGFSRVIHARIWSTASRRFSVIAVPLFSLPHG